MDSFSSSSYLLGHLPDYTNLWGRPPPPQLTRPASPPRRNAVSMNDARTQNYMADLQHNATLRAAYHHSIGGYLPSRAGPSSAMYAYGMDETSSLASTSGSSSASRLKPQPRRAYPGAYAAGSHAPPWRGDWKEEVKLREAIESGSVWSGSGVTDEEERALAHEETLDLDMVSFEGDMPTTFEERTHADIDHALEPAPHTTARSPPQLRPVDANDPRAGAHNAGGASRARRPRGVR